MTTKNRMQEFADLLEKLLADPPSEMRSLAICGLVSLITKELEKYNKYKH